MIEVADRDARTVILRVRDRSPRHSPPMDPQQQCCARCGSATATFPRRHRYRTRQSFTLRLGEALTLGACLLTLVRWPSTMAAPASPKRRPIPNDHARLWVNPCGYTDDPASSSQPVHDMVLTDKDILYAIILQSGLARDSVESFKNEYVMETFGCDFDSHHNSFKSMQYEWYKKVPKGLGIPTDAEHLGQLKLDNFLTDAYHLLQIMAVALEQVAWDMKEDGSKFVQEFRDVEYKLRNVLCEIQWALIERRLINNRHPDPSRSVMGDEYRYLDATHRHQRDWLIFRDYMIVLEYVREVLQYFLDNPSRISPS